MSCEENILGEKIQMKIIYPKHTPGDLADFYYSEITNKDMEEPTK